MWRMQHAEPLKVLHRSTNNPPGSFNSLRLFLNLPLTAALAYSSSPLRSKNPLMLLSEARPKPLECYALQRRTQ